MTDVVRVDLPDDDQQLNKSKRTLQYVVDLSLYSLNITLNFTVKGKSFFKILLGFTNIFEKIALVFVHLLILDCRSIPVRRNGRQKLVKVCLRINLIWTTFYVAYQ